MLCQHPQSPSLKKLKSILHKYNLPELTAIPNEQHTYRSWKKKITIAARLYVTSSTYQEVEERSTLLLFAGINPEHLQELFPSTIDPPHLRKAIEIKAQLLTGTYLTNSRICKISKTTQDSHCSACGPVEETVVHMVGECSRYHDERSALLSKFPEAVTAGLDTLSSAQRYLSTTKLILLGTAGHDKIEIADFHKITLQYLIDIHHIRLL